MNTRILTWVIIGLMFGKLPICSTAQDYEALKQAIERDFLSGGTDVTVYRELVSSPDAGTSVFASLRLTESLLSGLDQSGRLEIYQSLHQRQPDLVEAILGLASCDALTNRANWLKECLKRDTNNALYHYLWASHSFQRGEPTNKVLELIEEGSMCTKLSLPSSFTQLRTLPCFNSIPVGHRDYLQLSPQLNGFAYAELNYLEKTIVYPLLSEEKSAQAHVRYSIERFYRLVGCSQPASLKMYVFGRSGLRKHKVQLNLMQQDVVKYENEVVALRELDTASNEAILHHLYECCSGMSRR